MAMKTIQLTLDDDLLEAVDDASRYLRVTRAAFVRQALVVALDRFRAEQLETRHRLGYERHPVHSDEFSDWETEQAWGDERCGE